MADLHHSVLQAGSDEELVGLHVEDEVGSDRLWEILERHSTDVLLHFHNYLIYSYFGLIIADK